MNGGKCNGYLDNKYEARDKMNNPSKPWLQFIFKAEDIFAGWFSGILQLLYAVLVSIFRLFQIHREKNA